MTTVLLIVCGFFAGFAVYEFISAFLVGSSSVGRKQIKNLDKWSRSETTLYNSTPFKQIIDVLSKYVNLEENSRRKLELDLQRAKLPYSPEEYTISLYIGLVSCMAVAALMMAANSTLLAALMALAGVYLWMAQRDHLRYNLKIKDKQIAKELPGFVLSIKSSLEGDRDILHCVERYVKIAGEALKPELEVFLLEAKSGNFDMAIHHFANRLNNEHAANLASVLIQVNKGVDQSSALDYLGHEMQSLQNQLIDAELAARPGRMQKAVIPVFISGIIMMFATMFISVMDAVSAVF